MGMGGGGGLTLDAITAASGSKGKKGKKGKKSKKGKKGGAAPAAEPGLAGGGLFGDTSSKGQSVGVIRLGEAPPAPVPAVELKGPSLVSPTLLPTE